MYTTVRCYTYYTILYFTLPCYILYILYTPYSLYTILYLLYILAILVVIFLSRCWSHSLCKAIVPAGLLATTASWKSLMFARAVSLINLRIHAPGPVVHPQIEILNASVAETSKQAANLAWLDSKLFYHLFTCLTLTPTVAVLNLESWSILRIHIQLSLQCVLAQNREQRDISISIHLSFSRMELDGCPEFLAKDAPHLFAPTLLVLLASLHALVADVCMWVGQGRNWG